MDQILIYRGLLKLSVLDYKYKFLWALANKFSFPCRISQLAHQSLRDEPYVYINREKFIENTIFEKNLNSENCKISEYQTISRDFEKCILRLRNSHKCSERLSPSWSSSWETVSFSCVQGYDFIWKEITLQIVSKFIFNVYWRRNISMLSLLIET